MKRIFNIILFALFCTSFAQAQGGKTFEFTYEGQTLKYEIISEADVAVGKQERTTMHIYGIVSRDTVYSGPAGDVKIPSEVTFEGKTYKVTSIIKDAFEINPYLKSVSLPGTLNSIDKKAWGHCPELEQIEVSPDNQYYSSEDGALFNKAKDTLIAFPMNKKNLSYIVPNTVKRIEPNTLYNIGRLEKIEVAADNQYYSSEDGVLFNKAKDSLLAFPKKRGNLSYVVPNTVKWIEPNALYNIGCLEKIEVAADNQYYSSEDGVLFNKAKDTLLVFPLHNKMVAYEIPKSVTCIRRRAFFSENLKSVTIPKTVKSIGEHVFWNSAVESVVISQGVKMIGDFAFANCSSLKNVSIPQSVVAIGTGAFFGCDSLESVVIPQGVKTIGEAAFAHCRKLKTVSIPKSVTEIGGWAFVNCGKLDSVKIPKSVDRICKGTFACCKTLSNLEISKSVRSIADSAFIGCVDLDSVMIPKSVNSVGADAFNRTEHFLYDIDFQTESKKRGGKETTVRHVVCSLKDADWIVRKRYNIKKDFWSESRIKKTGKETTVIVPDSKYERWKKVFEKSSKVKVAGAKQQSKEGSELSATRNATVVDTCIVNRDGDTIWYNLDMEAKTASVTYKGKYRYSNNKYSGSITIPKKIKCNGEKYRVTAIGKDAFLNCAGLTSVTIPNSVTAIGRSAFLNCAGLTSVTIPNSVTTIGEWAFASCSGLTSVTIPSSVTTIDDEAFKYCTSLTSVTIPNSVTTIGTSAFEGCTGLTSVTIPNSVTTIGKDAFGSCRNLKNINVSKGNSHYSSENGVLFDITKKTLIQCPRGIKGNYAIPNSVTTIGERAFYNCDGLTSVTLPNSVTTIGEYAFEYCKGLTSVTLPNSVTAIGKKAFLNCTGLTSVTIPNSITTIGEWAFPNCASLTSVAIPNSVTTIGESAFFNCTGLTSVSIPNSVTTIGESAFYSCDGLSSVTIPNSVTTIDKDAFRECKGLINVTIPNSVTMIGERAFCSCDGLTSVTLPNSVTEIGKYAFADCENLKSINVVKDNLHYCSENGVLFDNTKKTLIQYPCGIKGNYAIPNGVTTIEDGAFLVCAGLTSVTIPNSVTSIGRGAFAGCTGLTCVTIPNSVTKIDIDAFRDCSVLTNVTIGNSITTIGTNAFLDCTGLTILTIENATPPEIYGPILSGVAKNITIYVPAESVEKYKTAKGWSEYADKIKAIGK
jgi:hypothetical protein